MDMSEKRSSERIHVEIPVHIGQAESVSRDVSWAGIYFISDHLFAEEGDFYFSLDLDYALPGKSIRVGCHGEVVRVERRGRKFGIAAKINDFHLVH